MCYGSAQQMILWGEELGSRFRMFLFNDFEYRVGKTKRFPYFELDLAGPSR